ncbi:MAG: hypothetical protein QM647_11490 [Asticcacaulis sp.]|uniref:hypothetical protein n=1 Tax=Asticcacaulis sp. TaxID=1872648 RepID=UPI0039E37EC8
MTWQARLMTSAALLCLLSALGCRAVPKAPVAKTIDPAVLSAHMCGKPEGRSDDKPLPLLKGLAPIHFDADTGNAEAQAYFDQGFALLYGFEYPTAVRSFHAARVRDADCALCSWGEALAMGPNINQTEMAPQEREKALAIVQAALAKPGLRDRTRALLEALATRYAANPVKAQGGVHTEDFANAMAAIADKWPDDNVLQVLAAESAMDVRPWDYWEAGGHTAYPWAQKAIDRVEKVLARSPDQPEAIHLYIHLTEASDRPQRAEKYADRLGILAPNSPHLVHMPSHTYYPVGRLGDAIDVNIKAMAIDEGLARDLGEKPAYFGYYYHHATFIMSAAQQVGDAANALRLASESEAGVTSAKPESWDEYKLVVAMQSRAQFMAPADFLSLKAPDKTLQLLTAVWRHGRVQAYLAQGNLGAARRELAILQKLRGLARLGGDNGLLFDREVDLAQGRVAMALGDAVTAGKVLSAAVEIDGRLAYSEPPQADRPAGVTLGAAKLEVGDAQGALAAFDAALKMRPGNAYALWGKAQAQERLGDKAGSVATMAEFHKVWRGGATPVTLASL